MNAATRKAAKTPSAAKRIDPVDHAASGKVDGERTGVSWKVIVVPLDREPFRLRFKP